ncbi:hypothetical protein [Alloactinosynnema sp. L-07]|uniref:hypothetical protein n=1 Tax=Alloactinosynnema sp. L-07 TaxID=1653480 RepID=UPI0012F7DEDA|nr:hypothetical protein [Alloactinosynnema sp. L-07]
MSGMRVLDVDERERLLIAVGQDLAELDTKGTRRDLARVPDLTAAKYLPGERKIVIQHGSPARLSQLKIGGRLTPLLGSADHATELLGVLPGRVVYRANRRHRLLFTVVIRNVLVGEETAVYDRGGSVLEAAVSPNSRYVAIRLPRKLILVDTMPVTEDDHVRLISAEPATLGRRNLRWLPDSTRLVATEYAADEARVVRWTVGAELWQPVVPSLPAGAEALVAPDGRRIAVVDGQRISFHQTDNGRFLRAADLPDQVDEFIWSPASRSVAISTKSGEAAVVTANTAAVRTV